MNSARRNRLMSARVLTVLIAAWACAGPGAAMAAGEEGMVAIKGHSGEKKYSYMILTPDDLKVCVDLGSEMVTLKKTISDMEPKLTTQENELKAFKTRLDSKKLKSSGAEAEAEAAPAPAKSASKEDLDAFNQRVEGYNAKVEAYKKDVAKFNSSAEKHNAAMEKYKNNCAGWKFYQEDFDALMKNGGK